MIEAEITKWLLVCAATLKGKATSEVNAELTGVWAVLFEKIGVQIDDVAPVFTEILEKETFFPVPADFFKRWRKLVDRTRPATILQDPVIVAESDLNVMTLTDRSLLAPGQQFRELHHDKIAPLPVTEQQRAEAMERIERPVAGIAKKRRMKAVDLIAQDKRIQVLPVPTEEEIEENRALIRRQAGL